MANTALADGIAMGTTLGGGRECAFIGQIKYDIVLSLKQFIKAH